MAAEKKYVYGFVKESKPRAFTLAGVENGRVYTINQGKVSAVVSDIDVEQIDPTRRNAIAHTAVQEKVMKDSNLLPMRFGMIASSKDEIIKTLETNQQGILNELERLDNKIEVEVKVMWDRDAMVKELQKDNDEISRIKARIEKASPVEARQLQIEAGQLVEQIVKEWQDRYAKQVFNDLKKLAIDAQMNDLFGIQNILNASFLIEKKQEEAFRKKVYELDSKYQGKVNFKYLAPLPPYNFVSLKLEPVKV